MENDPTNNGNKLEQKIERDENGRFLPGTIANPLGRPVGTVSITEAIRAKLTEIPEGHKRTYLALLVDRVLKKAIEEGDNNIIRAMWNYMDGMPPLTGGLDFTTKGESMNNTELIAKLTEKLNALYGGSNSGGDGKPASVVGPKTPDQE